MIKQLIISDKNIKSLKLKKIISNLLNKNKFFKKDFVVVVGGDGFMLQTLKKNKNSKNTFME